MCGGAYVEGTCGWKDAFGLSQSCRDHLFLASIHLESIVDVEATVAPTADKILGCSHQNIELRVTKVTLHFVLVV